MVLSASGSSAALVIAEFEHQIAQPAESRSASGSAAIASACWPISAGKRTRPCSTARPSCGLSPVRPTERASAEVGRGGGVKRPPRRRRGARSRRCRLLRQGQRVEPLEQFGAILLAHVASRIAETWSDQPAAQARALLGRGRAARRRARAATNGRPAVRAARAARRTRRGRRRGCRSSGSWPGGQGDEAERAARADMREGPAAPRAPPPSARPRRRRSTARGRGRASRAGRAALRSARCRAARPPRRSRPGRARSRPSGLRRR